MENKKRLTIAIMYDFDKTLSTSYMQEFNLLPKFGEIPEQFWKTLTEYLVNEKMDFALVMMYGFRQMGIEKGMPLTRELLREMGKDVKFYPGVESWFENINEYGEKNGVNVEHYIISSGFKELIEGTTIANRFKNIFACEYHYDKNGFADWPSVAVNYTNKTQYIYRINKGKQDVFDDNGVNGFMPKEERPISFENMIYFGDGETDVPCMKLVKSRGGVAVVVYEDKNKQKAFDMLSQDRVSMVALADYTEGSEADRIIKNRIREISLENCNNTENYINMQDNSKVI